MLLSCYPHSISILHVCQRSGRDAGDNLHKLFFTTNRSRLPWASVPWLAVAFFKILKPNLQRQNCLGKSCEIFGAWMHDSILHEKAGLFGMQCNWVQDNFWRKRSFCFSSSVSPHLIYYIFLNHSAPKSMGYLQHPEIIIQINPWNQNLTTHVYQIFLIQKEFFINMHGKSCNCLCIK